MDSAKVNRYIETCELLWGLKHRRHPALRREARLEREVDVAMVEIRKNVSQVSRELVTRIGLKR